MVKSHLQSIPGKLLAYLILCKSEIATENILVTRHDYFDKAQYSKFFIYLKKKKTHQTDKMALD